MQLRSKDTPTSCYSLSGLAIKVTAGRECMVEVVLAHGGTLLSMNGPWHLVVDADNVVAEDIAFEFVGVAEDDRYYLRPVRVESSWPTRAGFQLLQRNLNESATDFLRRWLIPGNLDNPDGRIGPVDELDRIFPPGAVLGLGATDDVGDRVSALHGPTMAATAFAGLFELPNGHWSWFAHVPGSNDPNLVCKLNSKGWGLDRPKQDGSIRGGTKALWFRREFRFDDALQTAWLARLLGRAPPEKAPGELPDDFLPARPMTVRWSSGGNPPFYFCSGVTLELIFDSGADTNNAVLHLVLEETRPSWPVTAAHMPGKVLGRWEKWLGSEQPFLGLVKPVSEKEGGPVPGFASWQLGEEESDGLLVGVLSPGFVRDGHSAFSAQMKLGDWVVVDLQAGRLPLVVGALQRTREHPCEVQIAAASFAAVTVQADGNPAGTEMVASNDGTLVVRATKSFAAMEKLTLNAQKLDIGVDADVAGALNVGKSATVADSLDVGKAGAAIGTSTAGVVTAEGLVAAATEKLEAAAEQTQKAIEAVVANAEKKLQARFDAAIAPLTKQLNGALSQAREKLAEVEKSAQETIKKAREKAEELEREAREGLASAQNKLKGQAMAAVQQVENEISRLMKVVGAEVAEIKASASELCNRAQESFDRLQDEAIKTLEQAKRELVKARANVKEVADKADQVQKAVAAGGAKMETSVESAVAKLAEEGEKHVAVQWDALSARVKGEYERRATELESKGKTLITEIQKKGMEVELAGRKTLASLNEQVNELEIGEDLTKRFKTLEQEAFKTFRTEVDTCVREVVGGKQLADIRNGLKKVSLLDAASLKSEGKQHVDATAKAIDDFVSAKTRLGKTLIDDVEYKLRMHLIDLQNEVRGKIDQHTRFMQNADAIPLLKRLLSVDGNLSALLPAPIPPDVLEGIRSTAEAQVDVVVGDLRQSLADLQARLDAVVNPIELVTQNAEELTKDCREARDQGRKEFEESQRTAAHNCNESKTDASGAIRNHPKIAVIKEKRGLLEELSRKERETVKNLSSLSDEMRNKNALIGVVVGAEARAALNAATIALRQIQEQIATATDDLRQGAAALQGEAEKNQEEQRKKSEESLQQAADKSEEILARQEVALDDAVQSIPKDDSTLNGAGGALNQEADQVESRIREILGAGVGA